MMELTWPSYSSTSSDSLFSISVNSPSSIPSPVYQCRKARCRYIVPNCPVMRRNSCVMDVVLAMNVAAIFIPRGGTSQIADFTLFGMKPLNDSWFFKRTPLICSSTVRVDRRPRKMAAAVRNVPANGSQAAIRLLLLNS
uniref:Uncharacterized protein n=1 Tax=Anopheles culicifacies TaxID=139723 RepID=A0A182LST9_9DIPT